MVFQKGRVLAQDGDSLPLNMPAFAGRTRVQKHKRVAKPLMAELSMIMIDELGDGPARGS